MARHKWQDLGFEVYATDDEDGDLVFCVRCTQCQVAVINGVPCHEHGCPNMKRGGEEE